MEKSYERKFEIFSWQIERRFAERIGEAPLACAFPERITMLRSNTFWRNCLSRTTLI